MRPAFGVTGASVGGAVTSWKVGGRLEGNRALGNHEEQWNADKDDQVQRQGDEETGLGERLSLRQLLDRSERPRP